MVVPVTNVSRLTEHALSEAISLGDEVIAVTVVFDGELSGLPEADVERRLADVGPRGGAAGPAHRLRLGRPSPSWPLSTSCGQEDDRQVVVLIPVVIPDRLRYRLLHNQIDLALASELRRRPDVVVARVPFPSPATAADRLECPDDDADLPASPDVDERRRPSHGVSRRAGRPTLRRGADRWPARTWPADDRRGRRCRRRLRSD